MAKTIEGRLAYADLLRSAAIIAVLLAIAAGSQLESVSVTSSAYRVFTVYGALVRWGVPVFLMLSGMFLLDPKREMRLGKLFFHHILRIFVALVVWGGVYALVGAAAAGGLSWAAVKSALYNALLGNIHYHLRPLYVIIGLYLVTPILRAFVRGASRRDLHYFLLLAFLFVSVIPALLRIRPSQVVSTYVDYLNVQLVLGYVGYYVLGCYLKAYTLSRPAEFLIYLLGVAGGAVTVGGSLLYPQWRDFLFRYDSPNIVLMSMAVFVLFRYVLGVSDERSRRQRMSGVARISFGIYLVHGLFLMLLHHFGITTLSFNPILSVPVLTAVVFLCSFAVAWVLSKIPFFGRYLT